MQDMTATVCKNASGSGQLYDKRDNNIYTIQKLTDGNCWMTQNLRIIDRTIYGAGVNGHEQDSDMTSGSFTIPNAASGFTGTNNAAYYNTTTNNTTYGAYYSWCAATAGCKNASGGNPSANVDAASSICPKGWRLPKGGVGTGVNDFAKVAGLSTTNIAVNTGYWKNLSSPSFSNNAAIINGIAWPASGRYQNSTLGSEGTGGYYWSRTASSDAGAYDLDVSNGYFGPANSSGRYFGLPVRCIAYSS